MVRLVEQIAMCLEEQRNEDYLGLNYIWIDDDWTMEDTKEFFRLVKMGFLSQCTEDYDDMYYRPSIEWGHLEGVAEIPEFH